jgi:glycosyltransferase involved in cell wall biosynthesis
VRVAIVHDWLYTIGGAEQVLAGMMRCYPQADVFCLFDFLTDAERSVIGISTVRTSFLQRMPKMRSKHRLYLPLMPIAIEQFDLSAYDLVLSSSYAVAKGVLTGPDQIHVSYVHSPMRYAWDLQHQYLRESNLERGVRSVFARLLLHSMRMWDVRTAHGVNTYVANSHFIARRIEKTYGQRAEVVYPPVRVPQSPPRSGKREGFLAVSRLVPYKNMHIIVEAFRALPDETLTVVGDGPEMRRLRTMAGPNVTLLGHVRDSEVQRLQASARALIFAGEEDFGITMAEAQGHGTPVIALGRGGAREIVVEEGSSPTGLFFDQPTPEAIAEAVRRFILADVRFTPDNCHANALRFAEERFDLELSTVVRSAMLSSAARVPVPRAPDQQQAEFPLGAVTGTELAPMPLQ